MLSVQVAAPLGDTHKQTPRYYVSDTLETAKYLLPADEAERERLNVQSQMINHVCDNKLIWAPVSLKSGDIILDSGTGSGHWLLSVAKEVPTDVKLHGIDIQSRTFPHDPPPNTTFTVASITSLPQDWTSSIFLIHQRLLLTALQEQQWKAALKEMYRVLVPGGWVQLVEPNHVFDSPSDAIPNHVVFKMRDRLCYDLRNLTVDVANHLPGWLEEAGFINLKIECRKMPMGSWGGEHGSTSGKITLGFFPAIKEPVMKEGWFGLVGSGEEYDAAVDDLMRLCEETPETYFVYHIHVAQKPVS